MRISRSILLAWVTAAAFSPFVLFAQDEDTESQAKARQALQQKMKELQLPPATATNAQPVTPPAVPTPATPAVQPTPAVTPVPPPAVVTPVAPAQTNPEAADKLSEAVRQKMMELEEQKKLAPVVAPSTAARPDTTTPVQTGEPAKTQPKVEAPPSRPVFATEPAKPADDKAWEAAINAAVEQARAEADAARKAEQAQQTGPGGTAAATTAGARPGRTEEPPGKAPAKQPGPKGFAALPVLQGPPSGLSPSQEQRLQDLNRLYFADRITAKNYHEQRAKILSQP